LTAIATRRFHTIRWDETVMSVPNSLFKVDRQSKLPLYDQIESNLRELILSERLRVGQTLPSEWDLAQFYGVSRLTVRKALEELVRQHWLSKRPGVGTFVTKPAVASIAPSKLSFTEQMLSIGRKPSNRLISMGVETVNPEISSALLLSEQDPVFCLTRVRLADDIPILLESAYLSLTRFPDLESAEGLAERSLYRYLYENYKISVARIEQTLKPVKLTEEQARYLQTEPGNPSIHSEIVAYASSGEPVEYSLSVSNGEYSEFYFSFKREEY
jgi:GntR family transcriptional regulator